MESQNDRIAKRLAEIKAEEAELDRDAVERQTAATEPGPVVVNRHRGNGLRSAAFLIGVLLLAAGVLGLAVTLSRLAGDDIADGKRTGQAQVTSCMQHGPISNKGFGYWDSCTATITWDDGDVERVNVGAVFTSADIGDAVRVGDLGNYRTTRELARADLSPKPWLAWIGYVVGAIALVPGIVGVLILRELLRSSRVARAR